MNPEEIAKKEADERAAAEAEAKTKAEAEAKAKAAPSQKTKTEKEKASHVLRSTADRLRQLGEDPADVLGIKPQLNVDELDGDFDDDTPLTVGLAKKIQKQEAHKTSLQMAEDIEDEQERDSVIKILSNRIRPSGNAQEDLDLARAAVNSERNSKIAEEANRKSGNQPRRTASGGSQGANQEEQFTPTDEEKAFMAQFNLSPEKIKEARKRQEALRGPNAV